jgi:hypothetical protein
MMDQQDAIPALDGMFGEMQAEFDRWRQDLRTHHMETRCKFCLLEKVHLLIEDAEKAGDFDAALKGIEWLLEKMYPTSFGQGRPSQAPGQARACERPEPRTKRRSKQASPKT